MLLPDKSTRQALGGSIADMVLYYDSRYSPVQQGGLWKDLTGNGLDGTTFNRVGSTTSYIERGVGVRSTGVADGIRYIGNTTSLAFVHNSSVFAMACWAYFDGALSDNATLIGNTATRVAKGFWWCVNASNQLRFESYKANSSQFCISTVTSTATVNINAYNFLCVSCDGSTLTLGVNGVSEDTAVSPNNVAGSATQDCDMTRAHIGVQSNDYGPLKGYLDRPMIFRKNVTDEKFFALYQATRHLFGV